MIYEIDGITVHSESDCTVTISNLFKEEGTGRTEKGVAFSEVVRYGVRQIDATWARIRQADSSKLCDAIEDKQWINVKYLDPRLGITTKKFYAGDIICNVETSADGFYWTIKTTFTEQ